MMRWHTLRGLSLLTALALVLVACGGGTSPTPTPGAGIPDANATLVVTSAVPTAVAMVNEAFPTGTLILTQLGRPIAQTPDKRTITLADERFGAQGAPNGRYGVRLKANKDVFDLELIDYSVQPESPKAIPEGVGFSGPGITWKADSSGFAFFDFPPPGENRPTSKVIYYYDLASGQTRHLTQISTPGQIVNSIAFSPDGNRLLYVVADANAEGIGGEGSLPAVLDLASSQSTSLPPEAILGFVQWLTDGSGFLTLTGDMEGGAAVNVFKLDGSTQLTRITPQGESDTLVALSPDGRYVVTTSKGASGDAVNLYRMKLDGTGREAISKFTQSEQDQTITGLVWGLDGIYYSLTASADQSESTFRVDLDGANAASVAVGTLYRIVGAP